MKRFGAWPWIFALTILAGALYFFNQRPSPSPRIGASATDLRVQCETTKGPLEIVLKPAWSPKGAQRFLEMVDAGFLTGLPLYRCIDNFVCQAGVSIGRVTPTEFPAIADDPRHPEAGVFRAGYISFAGWSPHSRSVHFFVALAPATSLGSQPWETPFGFVSPGTFESTVRRWTTRYGEMGPSGSGPEPRRIERADGGRYLKTQFPELDYLIACQRLKEPALGDR